MMKTRTISSSLTLTLLLLLILSCTSATYAGGQRDFLKCLQHEFHNFSNLVYTPTNSSFISILRSSIENLRFATDATPKPQAIITPDHESQIPPLIRCAKQSQLQIRTRSGGHDFEGLSYVAQVPFVVIDLINLSQITVDAAEKTAWVGTGATIGSLYYRIAEKSPTLGFPAGLCPYVGVGGHFSGGGYGALQRKYGLSADNVIDARIIDANERILDRKSMGEDLFWAIRGGGGASFGVIVAWKVQLVDVPEKVTVFNINRNLEQNATQILHRWQYVAPKLDHDLFIGVVVTSANTTINVNFLSWFLGGIERLLPLLQEKFPELGLVREDCTEVSWIRSVLSLPGYPDQTPLETGLGYFKAKSNYVQKPIPQSGFDGIWRFLLELPAGGSGMISITPYGGRMAEISHSAIPFPHRAGNLYSFTHFIYSITEQESWESYISWSRRLYDYLTPYVSESPRAAYYNYRDLDLGVNNLQGRTSYGQASIWGKKYFKNNFDRLVRVKTMVDPHNFFQNEQSIPPLTKEKDPYFCTFHSTNL